MVRIAFLGDISFNDSYIDLYKKGLDPFVNLWPSLSTSDFVIGNLECIAKGDSGENLLKKPRLTTTVETLNYLNTINVKMVSLAQNHIYDHLEDGFLKTTNFLKSNNIQYLGASEIENEAKEPIILSQNSIHIGFLNYVTADTNPNLPEEAKVFINIFNLETAVKDIQKLKQTVHQLVVLLHWGGRVEGGLYPDWYQPRIARELIDAGADLIIGHHSHTLQPYEIYKGKYIFYSLGNFCFSDYTFENKFVPMPFRRNLTTIISVSFDKSDYSIDFNFFINKKTSFERISYQKKLIRRNRIFKVLEKSIYLWKIYYFHKRKILPLILFITRRDLTLSTKVKRMFNSLKNEY